MAGIHVRFEITPEKFLAHLTETVYQVALRHGFKAPFDVVEIDLLKAIWEVMRQDMQTSPACGHSEQCLAAARFEPWSTEALRLFQEEDE